MRCQRCAGGCGGSPSDLAAGYRPVTSAERHRGAPAGATARIPGAQPAPVSVASVCWSPLGPGRPSAPAGAPVSTRPPGESPQRGTAERAPSAAPRRPQTAHRTHRHAGLVLCPIPLLKTASRDILWSGRLCLCHSRVCPQGHTSALASA